MAVDYEGFSYGIGAPLEMDPKRIRIDVPAKDLPRLVGFLAMLQKAQDDRHKEQVESLPMADLVDEAWAAPLTELGGT